MPLSPSEKQRRYRERKKAEAVEARKRELEAEAEQRGEPLPVEPPSLPDLGVGGTASAAPDEGGHSGTVDTPRGDGSSSASRPLDVPTPERSIEELDAPGVYDLTPAEEQRLRDFWGYSQSERRTKRQRDETAGRIVERNRDVIAQAWELWHRQAEQMEASRKPTPDLRLDPKLREAAKRNPWDG